MSTPLALDLDAVVEISILGKTEIRIRPPNSEAQVIFTGGKPLALMAFLHCAPAHTASREQLLEMLWSDAEPERARHTLRQTFWHVRRKLGLDPFDTAGDSVRLNGPIRSDREAFLHALEADDPSTAIDLYHGDFFPEFAAPGGAGFEYWADVERSRLRALFVSAAVRVVRERLSKGRAREAVAIARRSLSLAPGQQAAWRLLLESLLAADDAVGASLELDRLEAWLTNEELQPDPATLQIMRSVRAGKAASAGIAKAPIDSRTLHAELVGRETEFSILLGAFDLAKHGRMQHVHIAAPAGFGKSRLMDGLSSRLRASRTRVVSIRGTPAERTLPYAFAAHLVAALVPLRGAAAVSPEAAGALVALAPVASNYLRAEPDRSMGDDALRRRALAVTELISTLAHDSPVVLLVDDVHWIDVQSRVMLTTLATRAEAVPLLLVTAARASDPLMQDMPGARQLLLAPLTLDDVGSLIMSIGRLPSETWADDLVLALFKASNGSPLLVFEALQLVMERGQLRLLDRVWSTPDESALIETLHAGEAMQQRIAALPTPARDALLRLSVAGTLVESSALPIVLPLDGRESLAELEVRGLVLRSDDHWRVAHDEIAAMAIDMASASDRSRANAAVAEYLERTAGDDLTRVLRAGFHRSRIGDAPALDRAFVRAVHLAHAEGDQSALRRLGREVLGQAAAADDVDALVKRLPWRLRRRRRPWVSSALLAASLAVLAIALSVRNSVSTPAQQFSADIVLDDGATRTLTRMRVAPNELSSWDPIELEQVAPDVALQALDSITVFGRLADGDWLGSTVRARVAKQGMDLVRLHRDGRYKRIASGLHDQAGGSVAPDGFRIAFLSGEWHADQRAEIAVLDSGATEARRITQTDAREGTARWSPDGTRLAFVRTHMGVNQRSEVCWISVDGSNEQCRLTPFRFIPSTLLAWHGDHSLLVLGRHRTESGVALLSVPLDSREVTVMDSSGSAYTAEPTGRMIVCACDVAGYGEPVVAVFSPNSPTVKRVLLRDGRPLAPSALLTTLWPRRSVHLSRIAIRGPQMAYVGQRSNFVVNGVDALGRTRSIPSPIAWQSLDPSIAAVDATGNAHMLSTGSARLVASVSGWRADTVTVEVRAATHSVAFREDWKASVAKSWAGFGTPPSFTVPSLGVLRVNGGAHLGSGVFSRQTLDARVGAGMRVELRLPVSVGQWQRIVLGLDPVADHASVTNYVANKMHNIPDTWLATRGARSCYFSAPRDEGGEYIDLIAFAAGSQAVSIPRMPRPVTDSAWHSITLQVFSDGRCGLAIDGAFVALSRATMSLDSPLRVWIHGQSVGTTVEIGAVETWTGVRNDIDWHAQRSAAAPRDNGTKTVARPVPVSTQRAVEAALR